MVSPFLVAMRVTRIIDPTRVPLLYCALCIVLSIVGALVLNFIDQHVRSALLRRLPAAFQPSRTYNAGSTV